MKCVNVSMQNSSCVLWKQHNITLNIITIEQMKRSIIVAKAYLTHRTHYFTTYIWYM